MKYIDLLIYPFYWFGRHSSYLNKLDKGIRITMSALLTFTIIFIRYLIIFLITDETENIGSPILFLTIFFSVLAYTYLRPIRKFIRNCYQFSTLTRAIVTIIILGISIFSFFVSILIH